MVGSWFSYRLMSPEVLYQLVKTTDLQLSLLKSYKHFPRWSSFQIPIVVYYWSSITKITLRKFSKFLSSITMFKLIFFVNVRQVLLLIFFDYILKSFRSNTMQVLEHLMVNSLIKRISSIIRNKEEISKILMQKIFVYDLLSQKFRSYSTFYNILI